MPLIKNAKPGSPGFKQNIETEIHMGNKKPKQAVAISYNEYNKTKDGKMKHEHHMKKSHEHMEKAKMHHEKAHEAMKMEEKKKESKKKEAKKGY